MATEPLSSHFGSLSVKDYVMVAAIDFGTTFSGYAFSFKDSKDKIFMNKSWGQNVAFQSYKTPTCVMVDSANRFQAFGYDAEQRYTAHSEDTDDYHLYRHFKMMLHGIQRLTKDTTIPSIDGKMASALEIFAMALEHLKSHLIKLVSQETTGVTAELIRWVITVPAIWSDPAKQFMREAALMAGIIERMDSRRLIIALEPEAASVFCRGLDVNKFIATSSVKSQPSFGAGTKYLVIDAGGGTVDLTAHEVLSSGGVNEIHTASGGAWGGTKVDQNFIKLLEDVLGRDFIIFFKKQCPQQWLQFMVNFELQKRSVKPDGVCKLSMTIPYIMGEKYKEICGKGIDKAIADAKKPGVSFSSGWIVMKYDVVDSLFKPVIDNIVSHIEKVLEEPAMKGCSYFMLVGGFADSALLQKAIINEFEPRVKVLVPLEAQMSVIKGAVLFGHCPDDIKIRKARYTYGTDNCIYFNPEKHDWKYWEGIDGKEWCTNVFDIFVKKGSDIIVGDTITRKKSPVAHGQTSMSIGLYQSDSADVQFVDEEGCRLVGQLYIDMPNIEKDLDRVVEVVMRFGGTEIQVDSYDVEGESGAEATIELLCD